MSFSGRQVPWAALVVFLAAGASSAAASIPDASGVYTACVLRDFGLARAIDTANHSEGCDAQLETKVTWGQKGSVAPEDELGAVGAGASVVAEPAGVNCARGGTKVTDRGGNVAYACDGAPGPAACGPGGTCSETAEACAYDVQCAGGQTCTWTHSFARFVDNGNGTVTDRRTCLMWEKKAGVLGPESICPGGATCSNPHGVNNLYTWTAGQPWRLDGTAATEFLAMLNQSGFAGHDDWRLPTVGGSADPSQCSTGACLTGEDPELDSILTLPYPSCERSSPCVDPRLGPSNAVYWSSTSVLDFPAHAWGLGFDTGFQGTLPKQGTAFARAVRRAP